MFLSLNQTIASWIEQPRETKKVAIVLFRYRNTVFSFTGQFLGFGSISYPHLDNYKAYETHKHMLGCMFSTDLHF